MFKPEDVSIFPVYPRTVILQFNLEDKFPFPVTLDIYRSATAESPREKLNKLPVVDYYFRDTGTFPHSTLHEVYYTIEVFEPTDKNNPIEVIGPLNISPRPRLNHAFFVARRMDEKYGIELKAHSGVEIQVIKQRLWGKQCSCYDPFYKTSSGSCDKCFGRNFEGGYWDPVDSLGKISPSVKSIEHSQAGSVELSDTQIQLRAFPKVSKDDLILETRKNVLWVVGQVQVIEHSRYPVKQIASITKLESGKPAYARFQRRI